LEEPVELNLVVSWVAGAFLQGPVLALWVFRREVSALLACREAPLLIKRIISEAFSDQLLQVPAFAMNYSMLHRWLDGDIGHLLEQPDLNPDAVGQ